MSCHFIHLHVPVFFFSSERLYIYSSTILPPHLCRCGEAGAGQSGELAALASPGLALSLRDRGRAHGLEADGVGGVGGKAGHGVEGGGGVVAVGDTGYSINTPDIVLPVGDQLRELRGRGLELANSDPEKKDICKG